MPAPEVIQVPLDRRALTRAAERHLHRAWEPEPPVFVFADAPGVRLPTRGLAFVPAGRGSAVARLAIRRATGLRLAGADWAAFALTGEALRVAVPFMPGAGLEVALAIDVARAGFPVEQVGAAPRGRRATPREALESARAAAHRR